MALFERHEMRKDMARALKLFSDSVSDEDVMHWDGRTLPYVPRNARAAVIRVLDAVIGRLPSREPDDECDSFSLDDWMNAYRKLPTLPCLCLSIYLVTRGDIQF